MRGQIVLKTYSLVDWCVGRAGSLEEISTIWSLDVGTVVLGGSTSTVFYNLCSFGLRVCTVKRSVQKPRNAQLVLTLPPFAWHAQERQDFLDNLDPCPRASPDLTNNWESWEVS